MFRSGRGLVITLSGTVRDSPISSAWMPYIDTSDPLRHGYGKDVLAFRFNQAGRLMMAPSYIANAQLNEFYTRRIGSLIRGRTTVRDVQALFGHAQAASRRPDGFVYYYTLDVFNPFEDRSGGRR